MRFQANEDFPVHRVPFAAIRVNFIETIETIAFLVVRTSIPAAKEYFRWELLCKLRGYFMMPVRYLLERISDLQQARFVKVVADNLQTGGTGESAGYIAKPARHAHGWQS